MDSIINPSRLGCCVFAFDHQLIPFSFNQSSCIPVFMSVSGANLAGGADSTQTPTTPYSVALTFVPNGNAATGNDNVNGNWTYGYDDFNRLSSSASSAASYTYTYDRYGNRWQQNLVSGTGIGSSFSFNGGNNRADQFSYDAAGNMQTDALGDSWRRRVFGCNQGKALAGVTSQQVRPMGKT